MEHGVYTVLLDTYYATGGVLPQSKDELYRIARAMTTPERKAVDRVADQFFAVNGDGTRHNKRADAEIAGAIAYSGSQREKATRKWGSNPEAGKQKRSARLAAARAIATHSPWEWERLVVLCGSRCVRCQSDGPLVKDHIIPIYAGGSDGIENLQPLCHSCNSSKGPDSSDLRPAECLPELERMRAERVPNACRNASKTPNSHSHSHKDLTPKPREPDGSPSEPAVPDCPQQAILALYAKHLPTLTQPRLWEGPRAELLRVRWRHCAKANAVWPGYATQAEGLAFWEQFFAGVAASRTLTEGIPRGNGSTWKPDLPWLLKAENFTKVIERKYHE